MFQFVKTTYSRLLDQLLTGKLSSKWIYWCWLQWLTTCAGIKVGCLADSRSSEPLWSTQSSIYMLIEVTIRPGVTLARVRGKTSCRASHVKVRPCGWSDWWVKGSWLCSPLTTCTCQSPASPCRILTLSKQPVLWMDDISWRSLASGGMPGVRLGENKN